MAKLLGVELTNENLVIAGVGLPIAYLAYRTIRATKTALDSVGQFVERREHDANVFHAVANGVTEIVTVDRNQTLGGAIFDATHVTTKDGRILGPVDAVLEWGRNLFGGSSSPSDGLQEFDVAAIGSRRISTG